MHSVAEEWICFLRCSFYNLSFFHTPIFRSLEIRCYESRFSRRRRHSLSDLDTRIRRNDHVFIYYSAVWNPFNTFTLDKNRYHRFLICRFKGTLFRAYFYMRDYKQIFRIFFYRNYYLICSLQNITTKNSNLLFVSVKRNKYIKIVRKNSCIFLCINTCTRIPFYFRKSRRLSQVGEW